MEELGAAITNVLDYMVGDDQIKALVLEWKLDPVHLDESVALIDFAQVVDVDGNYVATQSRMSPEIVRNASAPGTDLQYAQGAATVGKPHQ